MQPQFFYHSEFEYNTRYNHSKADLIVLLKIKNIFITIAQ